MACLSDMLAAPPSLFLTDRLVRQPNAWRQWQMWIFSCWVPVRVCCDDQVLDVGGPTARTLLVALLLRGNIAVGTDELIAAVWKGPGEVTRDSVYHYIAQLRSVLSTAGGQVTLEACRPGYRLVVDDDMVDWRRFRRLVGQARVARDDGHNEHARELLREALGLWSGPPLANLGDRLAPQRLDMVRQRLASIEDLATIEIQQGQPGQVLDLLSETLASHPGRERAAALMVAALAALGRRDEAGEVYRRTRTYLVEHLGLEPGADLESAFRSTLSTSIPRPPGVPLREPFPDARPWRRPAPGLPRLDRHFTGRTEELNRAIAAVTGAYGGTLCAVHGMAGVGKTTLVTQVAARLVDRFPDGTVFIDLHGHTGGRAPLTAAEALDRLLRRIGVDSGAISPHVDERVALYRSLLADRQMLIILDNARDVAQVEPLLPGAARCAVVITSRLRLTALDDAYMISLDVFEQADAVALFGSVVGPDRWRAEPDATSVLARVAERCGRLPLAIRIAAARHRARDLQTLADLDTQLADAYTALAELDDDDRSVVASFQVSLTDLPVALLRTFALAAIHPGVDFDAGAVAALLAQPRMTAAHHLNRLADRHLLIEHTRDRYRFHDLVAAFARTYVLNSVSDDRSAVLQRVADYYLRAAEQADSLITPHRFRIPIEVTDLSATLPLLDDYDTALDWLVIEQSNLADTCVVAGETGLDVACWQLAYTLRGYYFLTKSWDPWIRTHHAALSAARRLGDVRAEAMTTNNLGLAHIEMGHHTVAAAYYQDARRLFSEINDPHGEFTAQANHAWILFGQHRYEEFLQETEPVLAFYEQAGSERNAAITQRGIGLAHAELGRTTEAISTLRQALEVFTRLDLRLDAAMTLNGLGEAYQRKGDRSHATETFVEALTACARCGSIFERARAHDRLGQLAAEQGVLDQAREHWTQALDDYRQLGAPQAAELRIRLSDLVF